MSVLYLDTSALVKLVVEEPESAALAKFLDDQPDAVLCTSVVGEVELHRAAARHSAAAERAALTVLAQVGVLPLSREISWAASSLQPTGLRTLDALHIATAASMGSDLRALVAYELRLFEAAVEMDLPVASPVIS